MRYFYVGSNSVISISHWVFCAHREKKRIRSVAKTVDWSLLTSFA